MLTEFRHMLAVVPSLASVPGSNPDSDSFSNYILYVQIRSWGSHGHRPFTIAGPTQVHIKSFIFLRLDLEAGRSRGLQPGLGPCGPELI